MNNLNNKNKYIISVFLVTMSMLIIGGILWQISITNENTFEVNNGNIYGWSKGLDNALIIIETYPDFDCGKCIDKERIVMQGFSKYPDIIKVVYHHYPVTPLGMAFAIGLEAAGEQGKFWDMHDYLLDNTPESLLELKTYAEILGLNVDQFNASLNDVKIITAVEFAKQIALSQGIGQVSLYINRKEFKDSPDRLLEAIEAEIIRLTNE